MQKRHELVEVSEVDDVPSIRVVIDTTPSMMLTLCPLEFTTTLLDEPLAGVASSVAQELGVRVSGPIYRQRFTPAGDRSRPF
jgi:hypothetical protein